MLVEPENGGAVLRLVAADALKNAEAIMQAGIDEGNDSLGGGPKLALHPDVARGARHNSPAIDRFSATNRHHQISRDAWAGQGEHFLVDGRHDPQPNGSLRLL